MITDRRFAGADTLATSYALTKAIEKISKENPVDLVICGKMTIDGDTGQVGPGIARRLDIPPLTSVSKVVEINQENGYAIIHRKLEDGYEVVQSGSTQRAGTELCLDWDNRRGQTPKIKKPHHHTKACA